MKRRGYLTIMVILLFLTIGCNTDNRRPVHVDNYHSQSQPIVVVRTQGYGKTYYTNHPEQQRTVVNKITVNKTYVNRKSTVSVSRPRSRR